MSYTAPQYVDTKEQAVLALASVIADEDKTALGDGSVNRALDVLADVLAKQDVQVPQTNAGAILALAQYVSGGGGGGSSTTDFYIWNVGNDSTVPTSVKQVTGVADDGEVSTELAFTEVSDTFEYEGNPVTLYGIKITDAPVGAMLSVYIPTGYEFKHLKCGYANGQGVESALFHAVLSGDIGVSPGYGVPYKVFVSKPIGSLVPVAQYEVNRVN